MAGAFLQLSFDDSAIREGLAKIAENIGNLQPAFQDIGEHLLRSFDDRWTQGVSADGTPWEPLKPATIAAKKQNKDKILVYRGNLKHLHYQASSTGLEVGSGLVYAAIHQFGGTIHKGERHHDLHFKQGKDGTVSNRFVKKKASNFVQTVKIGAHEVTIPARPYLGLSADDKDEILKLLADHLLKDV